MQPVRAIRAIVQPYVVLTNQQIADIVKRRPQTLSDLVKIDGIGKNRVDKYGKDILSISKVIVRDVLKDDSSELSEQECSS